VRTDGKAPPTPRVVGTGRPTSRPRDDCVSTPRVGDMLWESWMSRACPVDTASLVREMYITCEVESEKFREQRVVIVILLWTKTYTTNSPKHEAKLPCPKAS
jgi:hypothetical protein